MASLSFIDLASCALIHASLNMEVLDNYLQLPGFKWAANLIEKISEKFIMAKFLKRVQIYPENSNGLFFSKYEEEEQSNTVSMSSYFYSSIHQGLSLLAGLRYWIGLSDQESEGNFVWVNGDRASVADVELWRFGEAINNRDSRDCCNSRFDRVQPDVQVDFCSASVSGVCEKPV